jgi:membrane-bound lytic murein transglycosylase D
MHYRPTAVLLLLPIALSMVGCATPVRQGQGRTALVPPPVVVTQSAPAPDSSITAPSAATVGADAASGSWPEAGPTGDIVAQDGPNTASIINTPPPDLFARLRSGFQLPDVDQPAVDRELNWFANNPEYLERVWGRAEMYMHYIVEELDRRKMPRELALLPVIESAFEPYAYSRARAVGLWQFIPGTGSMYGLKQNWWYDGRRDVVESTRAALDYLQALHDEFNGDWLLAIAAYNCGEGAVGRAVAANLRAGKEADFWHLKLPTETRAYVPKLLAMRRIVAAPGDYGLEFSKIPDVPYFAVVKTGGQIDLQVAADIAGIAKDELYELNPAFHRWATDPAGPYQLLLPVEVVDGLETAYLSLTPEQRMRVEKYSIRAHDTVASVAHGYNTTPELIRELNGLSPRDTLSVGDTLRVPSTRVELPAKAARAAAIFDRRVAANVPGARRSGRPAVHVVRRGDTLSSIARKLGTDTRTLARLNNMKSEDTLRAGQKLVVTANGGLRAPATATATGTAARPTSLASASAGHKVTYTVRRGDTLYSVARLLQVTVSQLLSWNGIGRSGTIRPGQRLVAFVARS